MQTVTSLSAHQSCLLNTGKFCRAALYKILAAGKLEGVEVHSAGMRMQLPLLRDIDVPQLEEYEDRG